MVPLLSYYFRSAHGQRPLDRGDLVFGFHLFNTGGQRYLFVHLEASRFTRQDPALASISSGASCDSLENPSLSLLQRPRLKPMVRKPQSRELRVQVQLLVHQACQKQ